MSYIPSRGFRDNWRTEVSEESNMEEGDHRLED